MNSVLSACILLISLSTVTRSDQYGTPENRHVCSHYAYYTSILLPTKYLDDEFEKRDCDFDLTGVWYNQHGSELILCHTADGRLEGEFRTRVETADGSAGDSAAKVIGFTGERKCWDTNALASSRFNTQTHIATNGNPLGFTVSWNRGKSVTSWTGHYHVKKLACNNRTESGCRRERIGSLHLQWVLTSQAGEYSHQWHQTRTGHDVFHRPKRTSQPLKAMCLDHPRATACTKHEEDHF